MLTTRRLLLRPVRLSEASAYFETLSRPEVNFALGCLPPKSIAVTRRQIHGALAPWKKEGPRPLALSIYRKRDRVWLGGLNLRWPHRGVGELGYYVHPDFWGEGYASEAVRAVVAAAFEEFSAHRVQATCWVKNAGSRAVLKKAGLRQEGRLRGFMRIGDRIRDEYSYGITRADYQGRRRT